MAYVGEVSSIFTFSSRFAKKSRVIDVSEKMMEIVDGTKMIRRAGGSKTWRKLVSVTWVVGLDS